MHELLDRAKYDDPNLVSEIQSIDPAILVKIGADEHMISTFALIVVEWLQVSSAFLSTKIQIIQSNIITIL